MKSFKTLIILVIVVILVFVILAGIYKNQEQADLRTNDNVTTNYFGNEVSGDLDGDGIADQAFIITEDTGGSGTFFYLTALLKSGKKEIPVGKIFLGDRIAPQSTSFKDGIVTVNFADRKPTDSFVDKPSIGKSLFIIYDKKTKQIMATSSIDIFSATTTASSTPVVTTKPNPKITDHPWVWVKTVYNNDTTVTPQLKNSFIITFMQDNRFSAKTDCNNVSGEYAITASTTSNKIILEKMISTLMYCEGSEESNFTKMLSEVDNFFFSQSGELVLGLKLDIGSMIFQTP